MFETEYFVSYWHYGACSSPINQPTLEVACDLAQKVSYAPGVSEALVYERGEIVAVFVRGESLDVQAYIAEDFADAWQDFLDECV